MAQSARIGEPAATMEDYWICKGLLQAIGMPQADPWKGVPVPPARPPPGQYLKESRASQNLASYSTSIVFLCVITLTRLYLRAFSKRMRWGLDDWLMVVAFVRTSFSACYIRSVAKLLRIAPCFDLANFGNLFRDPWRIRSSHVRHHLPSVPHVQAPWDV